MQINNNLTPTYTYNIEYKLKRDDKLPLAMKIEGDIIKTKKLDATIEFAKTVFMILNENGPMFKLNEADSYKEFQEVFTGRLDAGVTHSDDKNPFSAINLVLNQRG